MPYAKRDRPLEDGTWFELAAGDPGRFQPVRVRRHPEGLLVEYGRDFEDPRWEATHKAVRRSGARFARGLGGWLLSADEFELDREPDLPVLVDRAARAAIDRVRARRAERRAAQPDALRSFRPPLAALSSAEVEAHPALSASERRFAADARHRPETDLSAKQRDWLRRIETRHERHLEQHPDYVQSLYDARARATRVDDPAALVGALGRRIPIEAVPLERLATLGLFPDDDLREIERIRAGLPSPWRGELQATLDRFVADHADRAWPLVAPDSAPRSTPAPGDADPGDGATGAPAARETQVDLELPARADRFAAERTPAHAEPSSTERASHRAAGHAAADGRGPEGRFAAERAPAPAEQPHPGGRRPEDVHAAVPERSARRDRGGPGDAPARTEAFAAGREPATADRFAAERTPAIVAPVAAGHAAAPTGSPADGGTPTSIHAIEAGLAPAAAGRVERENPAADGARRPLPRTFRAERLATGDLYGYQHDGVEWLLATERGILAHDVGLGKTVQAIAAACHLLEQGRARRALVIAPKPRLVGWAREIGRFTRSSALVVAGDRGERARGYHLARGMDFTVVGYHALQKEGDALLAIGADVLVVDEAHRLKGRGTQQSAGFRRLTAAAPWIFFLTATPMPNRPEELHELMAHLRPELLGHLRRDFLPRYCLTRTIRPRGRRPMEIVTGYRNLDELKERVAPHILVKRAADADVALDLPPLIERVQELGLADEQARLYARLEKDAARTLASLDPTRFGATERTHLLTQILRLEQLVIDPALIDPAYRGPSPKIDEAVEQIVERLERDATGTVLFCRFLGALEHIARALEARRVPAHLVASMHGRVSALRMGEIEESFRRGRTRVLLASDAAREGLNLQESADLLIHLDVPWVPNVVHQRNGRIHRQGQSRPVTVLHYRVPDTIESRKAATLSRKSAWIDAVLGPAGGGGDDVATALDLDDFRAILGHTAGSRPTAELDLT